jgi:hypothetical protein
MKEAPDGGSESEKVHRNGERQDAAGGDGEEEF